MFSSAEEIRDSLVLLGQTLEAENLPGITVLICGGAALNLSDLSTQTTADVDVIGTKGRGKNKTPQTTCLFNLHLRSNSLK